MHYKKEEERDVAESATKTGGRLVRHDGAKEIVVVGAGLVGALMGMILSDAGYRVTIYERYQDIRSIPSMGRSINLVLTSRGMRAIRMLGKPHLVRDLNAMSTRVTGRIMHQTDGQKVFQRYGKDDSEYNLSISRFELNKYLIAQAEKAGCVLKFGHRMTKCTFEQSGMHARLHFAVSQSSNSQAAAIACECACTCPVIGADGAGSRMRYAMRDAGACTFEEVFCKQGYKELIFPKTDALAREGLHIWPRTTHFLMALSNRDGSFTGTIYVDNEGDDGASFASLRDPASVRAFFETHYASAIPLLGGMDAIVRQMIQNPSGLLGTVHCDRFHYGQTVLIGDAGHAITPFFGQGTNSGFEDTLVLAQILRLAASSDDGEAIQRDASFFARAFARFTEARRDDTNAIARMALENFVEMRDKVGDARFLRMKAIENRLENKFPDRFRSRYAMVCYGGDGNITYSAAYRLGEVQWRIVDALERRGGDAGDDDAFDVSLAESLIRRDLEPEQRKLGVDLRKISHDVGLTSSL